MMPGILYALAALMSLVVFDLAALRWGADSRDMDPTARARRNLWEIGSRSAAHFPKLRR